MKEIIYFFTDYAIFNIQNVVQVRIVSNQPEGNSLCLISNFTKLSCLAT